MTQQVKFLTTLIIGIIGVIIIWPSNAFAWGQVTHLFYGTQLLTSATLLSPILYKIIRKHARDFLYGNIAADTIIAKNFAPLYQHCHSWNIGWSIFEKAKDNREKSFAVGYLSHIAADVIAHNYYIPSKLMESYKYFGTRHVYWEFRFDGHILTNRSNLYELLKEIQNENFVHDDNLMESVIVPPFFSFKTNQKIFKTSLLLQGTDRWKKFNSNLKEKSPLKIDDSESEFWIKNSLNAIHSILNNKQQSPIINYDPRGLELVSHAKIYRKQLKKGKLFIQ